MNSKNFKLIDIGFFKFKKEHDLLDKVEEFKDFIYEYKNRELIPQIDIIYIEAPLLNTPININTTSKLISFNGMVSYMLFNLFDNKPQYLSIYKIRKLFLPELIKVTHKRDGTIKETLSFPKEYKSRKKEYIWKKVSGLEPQLVWIYNRNKKLKPENYDMSDSYALSYSAILYMKNGTI
jgi:hypothetical protein